MIIHSNKIHGMIKSLEYYVWVNMKTRCNNPKYFAYHRYGGRGITVCDRWADNFMAFYEDMGPKPYNKAQIDRIDNDKGYFPENCHWASSAKNGQNKSNNKLNWDMVKEIRNTFSSKTNTYSEYGKKYGVDASMIGLILRNVAWIDGAES